jgi:hypothetical protein
VTLNLTIDVYHSIKNYHNPGVHMYITIPDNYPLTTLSKSFVDNEPKHLFYAIITVSDKTSSTYQWFKNYVPDDYYDEDLENVVIIREFYIKAREHHIILLDDEERMMKGLGKKCLCLAMPYVIDHFNIDINTTSVALLADGGVGLFNYYTKTYGFLPLANTRTANSMFMVTDLGIFMDHCR